ncbi:hypothetical protein MMC22_008002, partial [Lobaria immixta]|nr:hypothetical protein [Lobaria immixta]
MKLPHLALGLAASLCVAVKSLASSDFNPGVTLRSIYSRSSCCSELKWTFGHKVSFPGSVEFENEQNGNGTLGYWAAQAYSVIPSCRLTPTSGEDVSVAVVKLAHLSCKFAIRGGGHMWWAGASNIQDGVTIDLGLLKQVKVSKDLKITSVGGGARWEDVYLKLDAMNLAVAGGNNYFAPRFGFACDGVESFEIVLASGKIVNASASKYPDLYKALKGGNNNFGVVTRFDFKTFEQGKLWGGLIVYNYTNPIEKLQRLQNFNTLSGAGGDPFATVTNVYSFTATGPSAIIYLPTYTKAQAYPEALKPFTDIPEPQMLNSMGIRNLTNLTRLSAVPYGQRAIFGVATYANNATLIANILDIGQDAFNGFQPKGNFSYSQNLQPISRAITSKAALNGGNVLGQTPAQGDVFYNNYAAFWTSPDDDAAIYARTQRFFTRSTQYAEEQGQYHAFEYSNYALPSQNPIASYGRQNLAFLRAVAKKYDPDQVFQTLVPGGWKLYRKEG